MKKSLWFLFCGFFFAYPIYRALNRELPPELPIISTVKNFSYMTDQKEVLGSEELKGKTYIAHFFSLDSEQSKTHFESLQTIQKRIRGLTQNVAIISFSLTPEQDSVQRLFDYGRELHTNPFVWKLVTSNESNVKTQEFLQENFQAADMPSLEAKFALVDENGNIRAYYKDNKHELNRMMIDLGLLINRSKLNFKKSEQGV